MGKQNPNVTYEGCFLEMMWKAASVKDLIFFSN